jgi:DNA-directed RNA polymerase specialized sigma24 family protein
LTYKKLRFIAKSSNLELADLHNDLLGKVLSSFYSLVPIVLPDAHVVNYLKRVAHNHAINMIMRETTQKRGRLVNGGLDHENNRTFTLLVESENQMRLGLDGEQTAYDDRYTGDETILNFELKFSVSEILNRLNSRGKKYRLLTILMGHEDTEFTQWLRARSKCGSDIDNVDIQNKLSATEYNKLVSEFLHVSEDRVNVFLFGLRKDLALDSSNNALHSLAA